jgi:hypothetical protein
MADTYFNNTMDIEFYDNVDNLLWQRGLPILLTLAATNVIPGSLTANGQVTDRGGVPITRRGFCYIPGQVGVPTILDDVAYDDGSFNTGAFLEAISGLGSDSYTFRAYAVNSEGVGYGSSLIVLLIQSSGIHFVFGMVYSNMKFGSDRVIFELGGNR